MIIDDYYFEFISFGTLTSFTTYLWVIEQFFCIFLLIIERYQCYSFAYWLLLGKLYGWCWKFHCFNSMSFYGCYYFHIHNRSYLLLSLTSDPLMEKYVIWFYREEVGWCLSEQWCSISLYSLPTLVNKISNWPFWGQSLDIWEIFYNISMALNRIKVWVKNLFSMERKLGVIFLPSRVQHRTFLN